VQEILSKNQKQLKSAIPLVNTYDERLDDLNHWWGKISLIGKINSHNVSDSILEEMLYTKEKFSALQDKLIQNLLKEHLQKRIAEDHNKSQVAIDILIRNLFERTADVGFLATDDDIRTFLLKTTKQPDDKLIIQSRLNEYVKKYSVYDEIIVLDTNGVVQANLDSDNVITQSNDPLIIQTLNSTDDYTETFRHTDLQPKRAHSLIYSCAIKSSNEKDAEVLGVLCLCFRFDDEMQGIFTNLQPQDAASSIMITDSHGGIIATNHPQHFAVGTKLTQSRSPDLVTFKHQGYLSTTTATKGYQGFTGLSWHGQVMTPLKDAFIHSENTLQSKTDLFELLNSQLFSEDLKQIYKTSEVVKDDLNLVVLNGIIAAARKNAVEFMPVLTEIRKTGEDIASIFSDSIDNLQSTVISSRLGDVSFFASLAVDIMDRNLYERANDCRWWALTTVFRQYLQNAEITQQEQQDIADILLYINDLYTVYTNLYVYDKHGTIIAVSNDEHQNLLGQPADLQSGAQESLQTNDPQKYTVSEFVPSAQYKNRHTYIYNASITNLQQSSVVGGIGVVFDSEPQFAEMLDDTLPKDQHGNTLKGCFAIYCQRNGMIVSSTQNSPQKVGEILALDKKLLSLENGQQHSQIMQYQGNSYAVGIAASKGYREYKTSGDYHNDILAFVMMPS
jgi:hypothetical protein